MTDDRFEALLKRVIGLDAASIGAAAVERAVRERCAVQQGHGSADLDAYWTGLNASADELQMLIEAVVVSETWFFRDPEAFAALATLAAERLARQVDRPLRLLSLPCATGEEPYSMAMALFEAGIPAQRFIIDAIDVSDRALGHAAHAVYGRNSFRGHQIDFRERHFSKLKGGWLLANAVRDTVRFTCANLFDAQLLAAEPYDFVFCRNVLIYFDRTAQDRAVGVLDRLLAHDGTLFVGSAETGLLMRHGMTPAKIPLAFAFRRTAVIPRVPSHENGSRNIVAPFDPTHSPHRAVSHATPSPLVWQAGNTVRVNGQRGKVAPARPSVGQPFAVSGVAAAVAESTGALTHAISLADQGRFADAARLADEYVRAHGPSAAAFYLLGLVADASGRAADAGTYYRKALYLEPRHHEALTHLGALLDLQGDHVGARLLNERAARTVDSGGLRGG